MREEGIPKKDTFYYAVLRCYSDGDLTEFVARKDVGIKGVYSSSDRAEAEASRLNELTESNGGGKFYWTVPARWER